QSVRSQMFQVKQNAKWCQLKYTDKDFALPHVVTTLWENFGLQEIETLNKTLDVLKSICESSEFLLAPNCYLAEKDKVLGRGYADRLAIKILLKVQQRLHLEQFLNQIKNLIPLILC